MAKKPATQTGKPPKPRDDSVGCTDDALMQLLDETKQLVASAEESDIKLRYKIAAKILEARDAGKYRDNAVAKLADHLGWNPATVYQYANVALVWPEEEKFLYVASQLNKFDAPLSWSHFIEVAQVDDGRIRRSLLGKARKEGWSVRDLKGEIRGKDDEDLVDLVDLFLLYTP